VFSSPSFSNLFLKKSLMMKADKKYGGLSLDFPLSQLSYKAPY
jgi:hypothetical protein